MAQPVFSQAAEDDLCAIAEYIAQDKPNAARDWVATLREKCQMLAENPELGEYRRGFGVEGCRSYSIGA